MTGVPSTGFGNLERMAWFEARDLWDAMLNQAFESGLIFRLLDRAKKGYAYPLASGSSGQATSQPEDATERSVQPEPEESDAGKS